VTYIGDAVRLEQMRVIGEGRGAPMTRLPAIFARYLREGLRWPLIDKAGRRDVLNGVQVVAGSNPAGPTK
jgi:hypothetical protein